jgi:hypothetical protein
MYAQQSFGGRSVTLVVAGRLWQYMLFQSTLRLSLPSLERMNWVEKGGDQRQAREAEVGGREIVSFSLLLAFPQTKLSLHSHQRVVALVS